jgi:hypothetical protein
MRPISSGQNTLQFPLNHLLGTGAHVRLLRMLANEVVGPIAVSEAAERTGLTEAGARRALGSLSRTGFVVRVGGGRSQQFALRESDTLVGAISRLFRAEQERYERLWSEMREAFEGIGEVRTAWVQVMPESGGEPLEVGILGHSRSLSRVKDEVRCRLLTVEEGFDLTIELHAYTRADVPEVDWSNVTLLAGIVPQEPSPDSSQEPSAEPRRGLPTHRDREERALRFSRAIADVLDRDPSLTRRAQRHVERLLAEDQGMATQDLRDWQAILERYSARRLREFLVSSAPRAQRLRDSSPFFAVLNAEERGRLLDALEDQE